MKKPPSGTGYLPPPAATLTGRGYQARGAGMEGIGSDAPAGMGPGVDVAPGKPYQYVVAA